MAVIVARGSSWPFVNDSDRALGYREGSIAEDEGNSCRTLCRLREKAIVRFWVSKLRSGMEYVAFHIGND